MMNLNRLIFFAAFCLPLVSLSQDDKKPKEHYRIINPNMEFSLNYEKALYHARLDSLRFKDQRRQLPIEGTTIIVEIFSAQELLDTYKKPISPLTKSYSKNAKKIGLRLNENSKNIEAYTIH
jgi:hypothetical protein